MIAIGDSFSVVDIVEDDEYDGMPFLRKIVLERNNHVPGKPKKIYITVASMDDASIFVSDTDE